MNVIFLDIDGVLNHLRWFADLEKDPTATRRQRDLSMLDPAAIQHLNEIVANTGAVVVISSSWRYGHNYDEIEDLLHERGFTGAVIGQTPKNLPEATCRGDEIQAWLDMYPEFQSFVILDDGDDMGHLKDRLVHTSWGEGLLAEHVPLAVDVLRKRAQSCSDSEFPS